MRNLVSKYSPRLPAREDTTLDLLKASLIVKKVADWHKISWRDILDVKRKPEWGLQLAYFVSVYLIREYTNLSVVKLGMLFHRDHSTISYAQHQIANTPRLKAHAESIIEGDQCLSSQ